MHRWNDQHTQRNRLLLKNQHFRYKVDSRTMFVDKNPLPFNLWFLCSLKTAISPG